MEDMTASAHVPRVALTLGIRHVYHSIYII